MYFFYPWVCDINIKVFLGNDLVSPAIKYSRFIQYDFNEQVNNRNIFLRMKIKH